MVYDVASQKTAKTDFNGYTTTYDYDARGRLVAKLPDPARGEAPVAMVYTATGRKAQTSNGAGVVRYGYDVRERLVKKEMPAGTLAYTYDPHGNVATMKSSNAGGVDVKYGWDAANRLGSVTDPAGASTMEYDVAGRLTKRTDPNGVVMTYVYDNVNRVLDVAANRGTSQIADYAYTRDTIGRVTHLAELGGRTVTYGYSQAGRLVNETITGEPHGINGVIAYTHDSVGNRLTRTSTIGPVTGQTFAYDANDRITMETYDLNGNTLQAEGNSFAYDFEDRLVAIGSGVRIAYDGSGNIVSRIEVGAKTSYLVDEKSLAGYTQVVEELTGGGVSKTFTYGFGLIRSGGQNYVADGHSDVRLLTDTSGSASDEYDYDAFGVETRSFGTSDNKLKYTGERSEAGGLTYLRARHMRNATGRFFGMDPNAACAGCARAPRHLYVYGNANPIVFTDPSGRESIVSVSIGGAILGVLATISLPAHGAGHGTAPNEHGVALPQCAKMVLAGLPFFDNLTEQTLDLVGVVADYDGASPYGDTDVGFTVGTTVFMRTGYYLFSPSFSSVTKTGYVGTPAVGYGWLAHEIAHIDEELTLGVGKTYQGSTGEEAHSAYASWIGQQVTSYLSDNPDGYGTCVGFGVLADQPQKFPWP